MPRRKRDKSNLEKSSGTLYWRSYAGQVIEETDANGVMQRDYIFFAGRRVAWKDGSGSVYYMFADAIGSTRVVTNSSGGTCFQADYYPYGQEPPYNSENDSSCLPHYRFTGYEYDSETGNYYAYAREYDPRIGRFLSVDPLGGAVGNPQSLNHYSYVVNNPESLIDPTGMGPSKPPPPPPPANGGLDQYGCDEFDWIDPSSFCSEYIANWNNPDWIPGGQSFEVTIAGVSYYGTYYNVDEYFNWLAETESSPEARAYRSFMALAANEHLDPSQVYLVWVTTTTAGMVTEVQFEEGPGVNGANLGGWWEDPITFFHGGSPSWYHGYFFGTPHLVGSDPASAHIDPFGPLNPFHYLVQLPLGQAGVSTQEAQCSVIGGCTFVSGGGAR